MRSFKVRLGVVLFLLAATLFDIITYLATPRYHAFESNPIVLAVGSAWPVILLKLLILGFLAFALLKWRGLNTDYFATMYALYSAVFQIIGGISNLRVQAAAPPPEAVMPPAQAVAAYFTLSIIILIIPVIMSTLTYFIWRSMNKGMIL